MGLASIHLASPVDTPSPETPPRQRRLAILAALAALRDPQQRLQWVVERARQRPSLPDDHRTDSRRVPGCMARLWWIAERHDDRWHLAADSDAVTLKAIVGLLADCYDGETSAGIISDPPDFLERLGLLRQLAENRRATVLRVAESLVGEARAAVGRPGSSPRASPDATAHDGAEAPHPVLSPPTAAD